MKTQDSSDTFTLLLTDFQEEPLEIWLEENTFHVMKHGVVLHSTKDLMQAADEYAWLGEWPTNAIATNLKRSLQQKGITVND